MDHELINLVLVDRISWTGNSPVGTHYALYHMLVWWWQETESREVGAGMFWQGILCGEVLCRDV
jgi:hypothetical protein